MAGGDLCQARRETATLLWLEVLVAQQQPAPALPSDRLRDRLDGISRLMAVGDDKKRRRQMFHVQILSIIALTSSARVSALWPVLFMRPGRVAAGRFA